MDKATVSRLRIFALCYRLEDELLKVRRREGESSANALMRSMRAVYPVGYMPPYLVEMMRKLDAYMIAKLEQKMERLNEAAPLLNKGFQITASMLDDMVLQEKGPNLNIGNYYPEIMNPQHYEKPRYTGYCNSRSKYGPRTPKRR